MLCVIKSINPLLTWRRECVELFINLSLQRVHLDSNSEFNPVLAKI